MPNIRCRCGRMLTYPPELAGRQARCPGCNVIMDLPKATLALQDEVSPQRSPPPRTQPAAPQGADPFNGKSDKPAYEPEVVERPSVPLACASTPSRRRYEPTPPEPADESFRGFMRAMWQAMLFPLKGNALVSLLCGVVFFTVARFVIYIMSFSPLGGGIIALLLGLTLTGYAIGYLMNLVRESAYGQEDAPDWADLLNWQENAAKPLLLFLGLLVICFGAAVAHLITHWGQVGAIDICLAIPGALYLPMGLLCVALANNMAGLNPLVVVRAIAAMPLRYLILCAILAAATAIEHLLAIGIGLVHVPVLGGFVESFVGFYFLILLGRQMGLFYRTGGEKLKWLAG